MEFMHTDGSLNATIIVLQFLLAYRLKHSEERRGRNFLSVVCLTVLSPSI